MGKATSDLRKEHDVVRRISSMTMGTGGIAIIDIQAALYR